MRPGGLPEQAHAGLPGPAVPLLQVAGPAGADHVFPDRAPSERLRHDVVDGHALAAVAAAVLARVRIPLQDVLLVEGDGRRDGLSHEVLEADHRGDKEGGGRGSNDQGGVFDPFGFPGKEEDDRPASPADLERLEGLIQDKYLAKVHEALVELEAPTQVVVPV